MRKKNKVHIINYGGIVSIIPVSKTPIKDSAGMLKGKTSLTKALLEDRRRDAERGK